MTVSAFTAILVDTGRGRFCVRDGDEIVLHTTDEVLAWRAATQLATACAQAPRPIVIRSGPVADAVLDQAAKSIAETIATGVSSQRL